VDGRLQEGKKVPKSHCGDASLVVDNQNFQHAEQFRTQRLDLFLFLLVSTQRQHTARAGGETPRLLAWHIPATIRTAAQHNTTKQA